MVIRIVQRCSLWRIETFLEWAGAWRRENTRNHKRKFIWKLQKSKTSKGPKSKYKESSKNEISVFYLASFRMFLFVWLGSKFISTDEDLRSNLFGCGPKMKIWKLEWKTESDVTMQWGNNGNKLPVWKLYILQIEL